MVQRFLLLILFALAVILPAQSSDINDEDSKKHRISLSGQVVDSRSQEALSGVAVKLDGLNHTIYTDFDGFFTFDDLIPGKYDLTISYPAYNDKKIKKLQVGKSDKQDVTINLGSIQ